MFNQRLRELRLRRDMSQVDLAKALNVSPGTIGNYESGVRTPKDDIFPKLAEYFGVSEEWLRRGALLTDKQRKAIMSRFDEPLSYINAEEAEIIGINPREVWQALKSKAPLREDRAREIASAIGTRIDDILDDPTLLAEDELPEDIIQMAQDIYDKDRGLLASMADLSPESLARVKEYIDFVKSKNR